MIPALLLCLAAIGYLSRDPAPRRLPRVLRGNRILDMRVRR